MDGNFLKCECIVDSGYLRVSSCSSCLSLTHQINTQFQVIRADGSVFPRAFAAGAVARVADLDPVLTPTVSFPVDDPGRSMAS